MSVQFGRWNLDDTPVDRDYLEKVKPVIAPYGPDDGGSYAKTSISILYRAFHTTKESRCETQPYVTASGAVITWDGRLDNRAELIRHLRDVLTISSADVSIVAAAYEEWGTDCFARLIGDWALSIWDANSHSLFLAKDPIGTRHLYYSFDNNQVTWSTILDPLVLFAGKTFALCEEYIAGWFSFFPAADLTPYVGIDSVSPSSLVHIRPGRRTVRKYWDFDPSRKILYRTDAEYEEHFRVVFAEAVRRRLRSETTVLAELSGGMDSSSIVCMADAIISRGDAQTARPETISYYDDSEPNWNERPYFTAIEQKRGLTGFHINVADGDKGAEVLQATGFRSTPGRRGLPTRAASQFAAHVAIQGHRVLLSGIGGDEVLGGVPSPIPELADLLVGLELRAFVQQVRNWALSLRRPWLHLLRDTLEQFVCFSPLQFLASRSGGSPLPWLRPGIVNRQRHALSGYRSRLRVFHSAPSFQLNLHALNVLRRRLTCAPLPFEPPYEWRYPYLDRCLLEFLLAVPRQQLVRPGRRRSLMRRALVGVVPEEILERRRKGYVSRSSLARTASTLSELAEWSKNMVSSGCGLVDDKLLLRTLEKSAAGEEVPLVSLIRTISLEDWLRSLARSQCLNPITIETRQRPTLRPAGETGAADRLPRSQLRLS
jgi:asparagine synthase (glutamine-hydrolysing)